MSESKRRQQFYQQQAKDRLGDAPVEEQYHDQMTAIMQALDDFLNHGAKGDKRRTGIVVMVFPFDDHSGRCNYMSNGADREDVKTLMKEMVARFEGQPEMKGSA